jgi:ribosome biogenesis GTPase
MKATVLWGANNIFTLRTEAGEQYDHVRLKGKILGTSKRDEYNPLAPGDNVEVEITEGTGQITARLERRNSISRWNRKRNSLQVVASNVDWIYVVASPADPSYRTGFIDRVLVMAELEEIPAAIVLNKTDLPLDPSDHAHLSELRELQYPVLETIAGAKPPQVDALRAHATGSTVVLFGQSGVGKSTLINAVVPNARLATGSISSKFSRGRHTTTLARQVVATEATLRGAIFIDTPGVREFDLHPYEAQEIAAGFREFRRLIPNCRLPGCTHTHEPHCAIKDAVAGDVVSRRRYESYCRIIEDQERL